MLRHYTCRFLFYILIILSLFLYPYSNNNLVINTLYAASNRYAAVNLTLIHHVSITKTSPQITPNIRRTNYALTTYQSSLDDLPIKPY